MIFWRNRTAIFPGTFDPFHQGHFDIIKKAIRNGYTNIYIVIAQNPDKPRNTFVKTKKNIEHYLSTNKIDSDIKVMICTGLIADLARELDVTYIIRGYRNKRDKQYEHLLFAAYLAANQSLKFKLFKASRKNKKISSTIIKSQCDV